MRRLFVLATFVILLLVSVLFGLSDTDITVADNGSPNNEVTATIGRASNSSAGASITITMTTVADE